MIGIYLGLVFLILVAIAGLSRVENGQKFKVVSGKFLEIIGKKDPVLTAQAFVLMAAFSFSFWESALWLLWGRSEPFSFSFVVAISFFLAFAKLSGFFLQNSKNKISQRNFYILLWGAWIFALGPWFSAVIFTPWIWFRFRN